jgi:hypothetical protein
MSFSVSFFARTPDAARSKLQDAHAPAAVKALVELALAGIPSSAVPSTSGVGQASSSEGANRSSNASPSIRPPRLCGILVETHGHIDEGGSRSNLSLFRVEPYYD